MYRRTMTVVYKPLKNNYIILPENYFRLVSTYEHGCLNITFNYGETCYMSWASYPGTNLHDTEVGLNTATAQVLGIKEGAIVKCSLVMEAKYAAQVFVTPFSQIDWEMTQLSASRIQSTMLDQTKIVGVQQKIVVWLNKSISVVLTVDKLEPMMEFGRIENDTELIVAPFEVQKPPLPTKKANRTSLHIPQEEIEDQFPAILPKRDFDSAPRSAPLSRSSTVSSVSSFSSTNRMEIKIDCMQELHRELLLEATTSVEFRVIPKEWKDSHQINEIFTTKVNLPANFDLSRVYLARTVDNREAYVAVKILSEDENFPSNIYPSVEVYEPFMRSLGVKPFERIELRAKNTVLNFIERIDLLPSRKVNFQEVKNIEQDFKRFILDSTKILPIVLNQEQTVKIGENCLITVKLIPETFRYCLLDADIVRESKIFVSDEVRFIKDGKEDKQKPKRAAFVRVPPFVDIIEECVENFKMNLCLDGRQRKPLSENILLIGKASCGKSRICEEILEELSKAPFHCYYDIFFCARNKGRKPESIHRDLRLIFSTCLTHSPSILLLDNLDVLTRNVGDQHTQDSEYYAKVSDIIQSLILEFTTSSPISVIATVASVKNLCGRIYTTRGRHLFQRLVKIPDLEGTCREFILREVATKSGVRGKVNWEKFASLTEGYKFGDLMQFIERAIFNSVKENPKRPQFTEESLRETLKITSNFCLEGIESHGKSEEADEEVSDMIPGLAKATEVLEEVLLWPSKYASIFAESPLRNQAGVLLFGPPGVGKTFLMAQIARAWHLRMISVKGPELLAKYIGQSEENVRQLFDRARSARPCVLFFDEFDSLAPRRGHDSTGVTDRVVNQLLTELDGVESLQGVTVIGATSRPELLDPALLRSGRIDRLVECPLPDAEARKEIFEKLSRNLTLGKDVEWRKFAEKTVNFTGADIHSVLTSATMIAVKEALADCEEVPDSVLLGQGHLLEALSTTRPSLSSQDIARYKSVYAKFTNKDRQGVNRDFVAKRATLA
ncbi:peroxisomal ATPase PEX1 [Phlebotomus argentipes]|uniref:peroxisomal ATPase PEX1 n=1 Tax=Phlebotomus argentipes TaxID=94469 RepID=UPI00289299B5|nr:peroxisomal ATPase PEX1 [Phlebotomus argentipes]